MLAEERFSKILSIIESEGSATMQKLMIALDASESTIRRDLNTMDENGLLTKVHGGAIAKKPSINTSDENVKSRKSLNADEKQLIAKYAASLIQPHDFVYIDAGTTTECMIDFLTEKRATYVTNAVTHARKLAVSGFRVILIGGELKGITEAVVGNQAVISLEKMNFNKGFFGANGISQKRGYTTPDISEALVKETAFKHCQNRYVLADSEKLGRISSVTFGDINDAVIITDNKNKGTFAGLDNIIWL